MRSWPIAELLMLMVAVFLSVTTELLPTGLLLAISSDLNVSESRVGLLVTGYAAMVVFFGVPATALTIRLPRRRLLVGLLGAYVISNALMALAHWYSLAMGARLLGGLAHGVFWSLVPAYLARLVTPDRMGRAVAIVFTGGAAAVTVGVPLGTAASDAIGWRATYAALAGLTLLVAIAVVTRLPRYPGASSSGATALAKAVRMPGMVGIVTITALVILGYFAVSTYLVPILHDRAGLDTPAIAGVLFGAGVAGTVAGWLAGAAIDRWPHATMLASTGGIVAVLAVLATATDRTVIIAAAVCLSFVFGGVPASVQTTVLRAAPDEPDAAASLNAAAFNVGIGGGALLGGVALDRLGLGAVPAVGAAIVAAGLAVALYRGRVSGRPVASLLVHDSPRNQT